MQKKEYSIEIGGKTIVAEFNDWANQANGSVLLRSGNSTVLATAVMSAKDTNLDYFPLSVEYEEKFYAAGAILGSRFMRREGRPSDDAVLSGRAVDRTIRPLFPKALKKEVQVIISVLSIEEHDTDILAVNAASLALSTSNIPWNGPVSAVRIALNGSDETLMVNPTYKERDEAVAKLDVMACGKDGLITMLEVGAREVSEETLEKALARANEEIEKLQAWQRMIVEERGVEKAKLPEETPKEALEALFAETVSAQITALNGRLTKFDIPMLKSGWQKAAAERLPAEKPGTVDSFFEHKIDAYVHDLALKEGKRVDGRAFDEIRPLFAQAGGISPVLHGSGIFYRGETHVLAALTLGGPGDAQLIDTIESQDAKKSFMLHYNFPPFSVGETGRVGGMNRRMIGHGALAEKALRAVLPTKEVFPYTIRIVSECLASNGSTSQATICAGTLALMDAGVPITRPVAGIAMGMMSEGSTYKVLTDIQGPEDHHGDMDFKVAGTSIGVTAVQMDVKVEGVPLSVLSEAFREAKKARMKILEVIAEALPAPRADISPRAPKILTLKVKVEQIGLVTGPGGENNNGIREKTGVDDITIEDDGTVFITGKNGTAELAHAIIADMTREYKAGEKFEGVVSRVTTFGAFVKINQSAEGLVHVSEIAPFRIDNVSDALSVGETVPVIIKEIDDQKRINLSIKDTDPEFAQRKGLTASTRPITNNGRFKERDSR